MSTLRLHSICPVSASSGISAWCGESWCARAPSWAPFGAGLQTIVGGNISLFSSLCEKTRADAFELMLQHATELGANAVTRRAL